MRLLLLSSIFFFLPICFTVHGQSKGLAPYKIDFDPKHDVTLLDKNEAGKEGLFVRVSFTITLLADKADEIAGSDFKLIIEEDGRRVREEAVPRPTPVEDLSVILAMDTSGSMKEHGRMAQAKSASEIFLQKLPQKAECGLILFDHEVRPPILAPALDRKAVSKLIQAIQPRGGTAYLDAAQKGIGILGEMPTTRDRALVLMTDGIDVNSKSTLEAVITLARSQKVRVYTIGIGEPGKLERVNSVLVLDHSGSMQPPADEGDKTSKIKALHEAASRFVSMIPSTGRVSLIPFGTTVDTPTDFTNDKGFLINQIKKLQPEGETALLDATYAAIATLDAENAGGKRAVVAMTDGIDNSSRRRVSEVVARAKESNIRLFMLGLGRPGELDATSMQEMAQATGGEYYHAKNEKSLIEIFENLSIKLHDDGADEATLTKLALSTGGQYYPAKNVADLRFILEKVTQSIQQKRYEITFPSLRQVRDGTARNISLKLVRRGEVVSNQPGGSVKVGEEVIENKKALYQTHGVVVAEMNHLVYLGFLGVLGLLIFLPSLLHRVSGSEKKR